MLALDDLKSIRPMIAMPCYGMSAAGVALTSLWGLASQLGRLGVDARLEVLADSLVSRSRNKLVAKFLADESRTHLFWIDADVGYSAEQFFRILLADKDVVAGVYPKKQGPIESPTEYPFNPLPGGRLRGAESGFGEVAEAPTGFMCIKREVFDTLRTSYPELRYLPEGHSQYDHHWLFFDTLHDRDSGRYLSEDYAFCRRWRDCGGSVWVDLYSKLDHAGHSQWSGDLQKWLSSKRRVHLESLDAAS